MSDDIENNSKDLILWQEYCKGVKPLKVKKNHRVKPQIDENDVVKIHSPDYYDFFQVSFRKVGSNLQVEATLDLHGFTQERAYSELMVFLEGAVLNRLKSIQIITGKGSGVLSNNVPKWLKNCAYRGNISSIAQVTPNNSGALLVRLKRVKK